MADNSNNTIVKSLFRGTFLAVTGILSAIIEDQLNLIASSFPAPHPVFDHPAFLLWASLAAGVIVGDTVTRLFGQTPAFGMVAGIKKGLLASAIGVTMIFFSDTATGNEILYAVVETTPGVTRPSVALKIGIIWMSVVLSDYFIE